MVARVSLPARPGRRIGEGRKENPECGIRRGGLRCAFGRTSVHASRVKYAYRGGDAVTPLAESLERRRLLAVTVFHIDPSRSTLQLSGQTGGYSLESWDGAAPSAQVGGAIVVEAEAGHFRFAGGSRIIGEALGQSRAGA